MKTTNIIIRCSDREKEEIKEMSQKEQMSMSEYILALHRKEKARKEMEDAAGH